MAINGGNSTFKTLEAPKIILLTGLMVKILKVCKKGPILIESMRNNCVASAIIARGPERRCRNKTLF
jgi:hypothetical protein